MTASLPVPNDIDPEEPDRHTSARVVRLSDSVKPAPEKPPRKPRKGGSKPAKAAKEAPPSSEDARPGPPPPLPTDLERAASAAADIVVPPRPPLPPADDDAADAYDLSPEDEATTPLHRHETSATVAPPPAAPLLLPSAPPSAPAPAAAAAAASEVPVPERRIVAAGNVLELRGITKSFGATPAVDGIDLTVPAGTFYGLVGPNGAGKTTTLSIIAGLLVPDRGTIRVGGIDAAAEPLAAKRLMGVLPDRLRTFDRLTGRQLLYYYGVLRKLPAAVVESRTADLARAFDLEDALGRSVSDYSAGMLKKVMLAGALIHSPRLLVLDEPFEAVDPVSSAIILDILSTYVAHGGTVILSSHGMELVERVCSRVAVIVAGQVLAEGTVEEVRGELTLEQRFVELAGGLSDVEGLEWLHTFSD